MGGAKQRRRRSGVPPSGNNFEAWVNDVEAVSTWMEKYDLEAMLKKGLGIVKIEDFLPPFVAEGALQVVSSISDTDWVATEAQQDYAQNNIRHSFMSVKTAPGLGEIQRLLLMLLSDRLHTFSAARYEATHHIEPHDDRQYSKVMMNDGEVVECSRDIAVIYYLTKDWREEYGGVLVDIETGTRHVPQFNSLIAFDVPRFHEVTAVTAPRPRFSIFGWFLTEGRKYELLTAEQQARTLRSWLEEEELEFERLPTVKELREQGLLPKKKKKRSAASLDSAAAATTKPRKLDAALERLRGLAGGDDSDDAGLGAAERDDGAGTGGRPRDGGADVQANKKVLVHKKVGSDRAGDGSADAAGRRRKLKLKKAKAGMLAERKPDPALLKILDTVSERVKEYQFKNRIKRKKIIKGQGEQP